MDIRHWLENTADREPPDSTDDHYIPEDFRLGRSVPDQARQSYRHKRKRASSDSSIIAPKRRDRQNVQPRSRSPSLRKGRAANDATHGSRNYESSRNSPSFPPGAPVKTYERRARHKTLADRYEPKAKKGRQARVKGGDRKTHQKRRKSLRNDDGGRTTGLVQSFHLKNGPRNNRLTLKPDTNAGMFKHGRASMQMAGRGAGLPDLAFNEMRFLQKPVEHQDEVAGANESRMSKKNEQIRDHEEEISAYFNAKKSVEVTDPVDLNKPHDQQTKTDHDHSRSKRSIEVDRARLLIELPGKPFLGFGSKGARPLSNAVNDDEATYYTWSESVHRRSSPPQQKHVAALSRDAGDNPDNDPDGKHRRLRKEHEPSGSKSDNDAPGGANTQDVKHGNRTQTNRARGPTLVEVREPIDPPQHRRQRNTSVTKTTSQSLPGHPSSPPQFKKRRVNDATPEPLEHDSYRTSDILKIRHSPFDDTRSLHHIYHPALSIPDKENQNPESSLSIDKAIHRANAAVALHSAAFRPPKPMRQVENPLLPSIRRKASISDVSKRQNLNDPPRVSTLGMAASQRPYFHSAQTQGPSSAAHRPVSNIERQHWETAVQGLTYRAPRTTRLQQTAYLAEDKEMLDNAFDGETMVSVDDVAYMDSGHDEYSFREEHFTPRSGIFDSQLNDAEHNPTYAPATDPSMVARRELVQGPSVDREMSSDRSIGHQKVLVDDGLAGFWKPNKLY